MNILIDSLAARVGAGPVYTRAIVAAFCEYFPELNVRVLLSPQYQSELIASLPGSATLEPVDLPAQAQLRRWRFQQDKIPEIVERTSTDVLYTTSEIASCTAPCARVVAVRNLNNFAAPASGGTLRNILNLAKQRVTRGPFVSKTLRHADRLLFVTAAMRNAVRLAHPIDESLTAVVHHGIAQRFHESAEAAQATPPYILSVGAISPHKGFDTLVEAFIGLCGQKTPSGLQLRLAGKVLDPSFFDSLKRRIARAGLTERVQFLGPVSHDRLPELYSSAALFAFPSRTESFGNPPLEAMACGTPVLASDIPACREVCQEAAAFARAGDVPAWQNSLAEALRSAKIRDSMAAAGRAHAKSFTWKRAAGKTLDLFKEALAAKPQGSMQ